MRDGAPGSRPRDQAGWWRLALRFAAVVIGIIATAWPWGDVSAHAVLEEVVPEDGATLEQAPAEVVLTFDEPVSLAGGDARVLDDGADVVASAADAHGQDVVIELPGELADGTYVTAWRVISQDSHPVSGTALFHVGSPSASADEVASVGTDGGTEAPAWLGAAGTAAAAALYLSALGATGAWFFGEVVAGRGETTVSAAGLRRAVARFAALGLGASLVSLPLRAARLGGGVSALGDTGLLRDTVTGPVGVATAATAAGLLVLRIARRRAVVTVGSVLAVGGFALEGHTRTQEPRWALLGLDPVHVVAAAAWLGGLVGVVVLLRQETSAERTIDVVVRFSRVATIAVAAATVAGVGMAIIVLPEPSALFNTGYGLALVVKVSLVAGALALAAWNRRTVSAMAPPGGTTTATIAPPDTPLGKLRPLRRVVAVEVAVLLAVVVSTSVLVARSPAPASSATPSDSQAPASDQGPISIETELSNGHGTVSLGLTPGSTGANELWIELEDEAGRPLAAVEPPDVELRERSRDLGPLRPDVHVVGEGATFHSDVDIPLAGRWEVLVRVRIDEFASVAASTDIDIGT